VVRGWVQEGSSMIWIVIRFEDNKVMVFDSRGNRMPGYEGLYDEVKDAILKAAARGAIFGHAFPDSRGIIWVSREEW